MADSPKNTVISTSALESLFNTGHSFSAELRAVDRFHSPQLNVLYVGRIYDADFISQDSSDVVCSAVLARYHTDSSYSSPDPESAVWRITTGSEKMYYAVRNGVAYSTGSVRNGYRHALSACAGRMKLFIYPELFSAVFDSIDNALLKCALRKEEVIAHFVYNP